METPSLGEAKRLFARSARAELLIASPVIDQSERECLASLTHRGNEAGNYSGNFKKSRDYIFDYDFQLGWIL